MAKSIVKRIETVVADLDNRPGWQLVILCLITLLAAGLRFYRLGEWSLWIEEHHTFRHANALGAFKLHMLTQIRVPFYLAVRTLFASLGESAWTGRLMPAMFGIISIPLLFVIVRKAFTTPTAILATTLLAISPWHIFWSQNARFYTLLLLLYGLSLLTFHLAVEKAQFRYYAVSMLLLAGAIMLQPFVAVLVPVFGTYLMLLKLLPFKKPPGFALKKLSYVILLPLIGYGAYEFYLTTVGRTPLFSTLYTQFFNESTRSFIGYVNSRITLTATVYYMGIPLTYMSLPGVIYVWRLKSRSGLILTLGAFLPLFGLMLLTLFASVSRRYVFMTLPCWIVLAAFGANELYVSSRNRKVIWLWILGVVPLLLRDPVLEDLLFYVKEGKYLGLLPLLVGMLCFLGWLGYSRYSRNARLAVPAVLGIGVILTLLVHPLLVDVMYFAYQHGHRDNWQALSETIKQETTKGEVIFVSQTTLAPYYLVDYNVEDIRSIDFNTVFRRQKRVWVIEQDEPEESIKHIFRQLAERENCRIHNEWDSYVAGRIWPLRIYLCEPV